MCWPSEFLAEFGFARKEHGAVIVGIIAVVHHRDRYRVILWDDSIGEVDELIDDYSELIEAREAAEEWAEEEGD